MADRVVGEAIVEVRPKLKGFSLKDAVTMFASGLLSRKFLLALGSFITFVAQKDYDRAMWVVLGYLGIEGGADIVERHQGAKRPDVTVQEAETVNVETPPAKSTRKRAQKDA